jgi:hypothetical protein
MSRWVGGISKLLARFGTSCPTFSAKTLLINSHQAHQIAAHPFHHLPMGLSDDNPSSFGDHYGFGCHGGLMEGLASCWQDLALLVSIVQLFQPKPS